MSVKNLTTINNFFILFILIFSIIVNQYYASLGAFPLDTFYHFDLGYRILKGDIPFTDIWMVSGVIVNYLQAFFSIFSGLIGQATFYMPLYLMALFLWQHIFY